MEKNKVIANQETPNTFTVDIPAGTDPTKYKKMWESTMRGKLRDEIRLKSERQLKEEFKGRFNEIFNSNLKQAGLE